MEIKRITSLLENSYHGNPWHGPSLKEVLQGISSEQSKSRLENTHSIGELVAHIHSWRLYTINRLKGNSNFKMTDELNFPVETNWETSLQQLDESQTELVGLLKVFPETRLLEMVPSLSNQYTFYDLLHGLIHHDIYHAGQIRLISKGVVLK